MDDLLILILIAPFVGSFLGVVIIRLPLGQRMMLGRSKCPECGHVLAWWHMIPLLSYLLRRGQCAYCKARIPAFYPLIEIAALIVVLWAALVTTGMVFVVSCFLGWALLVLVVIDWRNYILPDIITLPLMVTGLGVIAFLNPDKAVMHLAGMVVAAVIFGALIYLYGRIRHREGLGMGDVKLFAAAGAWVGLEGLGTTLLISTLLALSMTYVLAFFQKTQPARFQKVPFGSYLSIGLWMTWLYGPLSWF